MNHNNLDQKPTHAPPVHTHGHGKWVDPHFDQTMPKNITSLVGKSAYLGCRVKNLGNKTVSFCATKRQYILFPLFMCPLLFMSFLCLLFNNNRKSPFFYGQWRMDKIARFKSFRKELKVGGKDLATINFS